VAFDKVVDSANLHRAKGSFLADQKDQAAYNAHGHPAVAAEVEKMKGIRRRVPQSRRGRFQTIPKKRALHGSLAYDALTRRHKC
jgi:hypothetical protein